MVVSAFLLVLTLNLVLQRMFKRDWKGLLYFYFGPQNTDVTRFGSGGTSRYASMGTNERKGWEEGYC